MTSRVRKGIFVLTVLYALLPIFAHAQYQLFGLPGIERTAILSFSPEHPAPGETIHLTVTSPVMDVAAATIVWYVDGKAVTTGQGLNETDIVAGKLGEPMQVEVDVSNESVNSVATTTIIPTEVDLLFDSSAYTPPFYFGRALPTMGSRVRLQALVRFKKRDGTFVQNKDITFTWTKNGNRIPRSTGKGLDSLEIAGPISNSPANIAVKAVADGGLEGSAQIRISSAKPFLALYEDSPLYGYLYNYALEPKSLSTKDDMTVAAVPYFSTVSTPNDPALEYTWKVNDVGVEATSTINNEITLGAQEGGLARIALEVTNEDDIFFSVKGIWQILFSPSTAGKASPGTNLLPVNR